MNRFKHKYCCNRKIISGLFCLFIVVLSFTACTSNSHSEQRINTVQQGKERPLSPQAISIYRFGDFPINTAQKLEKQLKLFFPKVVLKEQRLTLPAKHYIKELNRYRGTGLFEELAIHRNGDVVIGLTNYIIFKPNKISPTYGIMGVSPVGTYKCVVSSKIPKSGKEQSDDNFLKLSRHELGHAFGLNHCPNQHCYMVDAEHKMKFPQTTGFCKSCKFKLNDLGWTL